MRLEIFREMLSRWDTRPNTMRFIILSLSYVEKKPSRVLATRKLHHSVCRDDEEQNMQGIKNS